MSESVSIYKLGIYGKAYDVPGTRRAYTYQHQPDNLGASKLGGACFVAFKAGGGDYIDYGLALLKQLELRGFGVYELDESKASEEHQEPVAFRCKLSIHKDWKYIDHRAPDSFELRECEIQPLFTGPQPAQVNRIPALDEHLRFILGRPNFWCHHLANALRAMGQEIARKAEEEQAAVIHWLLKAYFEHGPGWREAVEKILAAEREKELAKGGDK